MPPQATPNQPKQVSRSLGLSLGVTEAIYILGLAVLAAGISLAVGYEYALIVVGLLLIRTAELNDKMRQ